MKIALFALLSVSGTVWAQAPASQTKQATPVAPKAAAAPATPALPATAPAVVKADPGFNLLKPETIKGKPPAVFIVRLQTSKGDIDLRVVRSWAPNGVERFYNLVRAGFYDNNYFFRVLDFMAQVGISSTPAISKAWDGKNLFDDRVIQSNVRGMVTFAAAGEPNSRSTQFFINKKDANTYLDGLKFAPFAQVIEGMNVVDAIYAGYGEPSTVPGQLEDQGEPFIQRYYPRMDKIIKAYIIAVPEP
jgi:peptidyl-prolyl cis-trans isomerase A (cyclophilin A)